MLLPNVPSNDSIPTNAVTPNIHTMLVLNVFASFPICILSDIFETIPNIVPTSSNGIITLESILPIKLIQNSIIGCTILAEITLPVLIINVIRSGTNVFINPIMSCMVFLVDVTMSEKFDNINVTINMYCT